jgi:uncharacterized membrane protein HdeD (DUF308 family)
MSMFELLARNWWVLVVRGVIAILFGVLAFIWPGITLTALVLLFGAYVLVDGIFAIVLAIGGWQERDDRWLLLLEGGLGVGIGIMTALAPEITSVGLLLFIAAWSLATGILRIAAAIRLRRQIEGEWWLALSGTASILFAGIVMWNPVAGALGLLRFIASFAIALGIVLIMLGVKVRSARVDLRKAKPASVSAGVGGRRRV